MLRVNVGLSRKVTEDFNSTGFSVSLDGEVALSADDPEAVLGRIAEFYGLAECALAEQVERYEEGHGGQVARSEPRCRTHNNATHNRIASEESESSRPETNQRRDDFGKRSRNGRNRKTNEPATNKQIQFLLNLGKKQGLSQKQLEGRVEAILGRAVGLYDLTKRDAGQVLDELTAEVPARR